MSMINTNVFFDFTDFQVVFASDHVSGYDTVQQLNVGILHVLDQVKWYILRLFYVSSNVSASLIRT